MNPTILNRDFQHPADGWYQIEPKGEHPNRAAGVVQVVDDQAASEIVNRFNTDAAAGQLRHGREMLIDHEHFSDQLDKESRAFGWLQELQNRADGIYGRIRWTASGKAAVDGGDYRFFSTEYDPADLKLLNSSGPIRRIRPIRLAGLTLTNMPNNRGQKPITNRNEQFPHGAGAPLADEQTKTERKTMKTVATKLGLSADASEEAVLAEVTKIMNRATEADATAAKITALTDENTTLKTRNAELLGEQVAALLDAHGVKDDKVRNRLTPMISALPTRAERIACLTEFGFKPEAPAQGRVLNRGEGKTPAAEGDEADDQARAARILNRAREIQNNTGGNFDLAHAQAVREINSGK